MVKWYIRLSVSLILLTLKSLRKIQIQILLTIHFNKLMDLQEQIIKQKLFI